MKSKEEIMGLKIETGIILCGNCDREFLVEPWQFDRSILLYCPNCNVQIW